jgi:hypothetical protein
MIMNIKSYIKEVKQDDTFKYISVFLLFDNLENQYPNFASQIAIVTTDKLSSTLEQHKIDAKKMLLNIVSTPEDEFIEILAKLKLKNIKLKEGIEITKKQDLERQVLSVEMVAENQKLISLMDQNNLEKYQEQFKKVQGIVDKYNKI